MRGGGAGCCSRLAGCVELPSAYVSPDPSSTCCEPRSLTTEGERAGRETQSPREREERFRLRERHRAPERERRAFHSQVERSLERERSLCRYRLLACSSLALRLQRWGCNHGGSVEEDSLVFPVWRRTQRETAAEPLGIALSLSWWEQDTVFPPDFAEVEFFPLLPPPPRASGRWRNLSSR